MEDPGYMIVSNLDADGRKFYELEFCARPDERLFLKPEDVGRAVVSEPFEFDVPSPGYSDDEEMEAKVLECLKNIIQPTSGNGCNLDRRGMRLALCGLSEAPIFPPGTDNLDEYVDIVPLLKVPMKLKLFSNFQHSHSKEDKEQSYITKLASCFGSQDFSLFLGEGGDKGLSQVIFPMSVELIWNQEDLAWEAETQMTFNREDNPVPFENFGNTDTMYAAMFPQIFVKLKDGAISRILNQLFPFFENKQHALRTLEEELGTDLIINDKNDNPVKCHRFPLMIASAKFGNMLNDNRDWKEASTRTINLDLTKDAILAMLHFIYYGGNDRIVSGSVTQAMDLLKFGQMYELQNLVAVTRFALVIKAGKCFTFGDGLELYRYSERMLKLEGSPHWKELMDKGSLVFGHYRYWDYKGIKNSELYQKLLSIAESLGPAFVPLLNETHLTNAGAKALPINLRDVSMEDCKLLSDSILLIVNHFRTASRFTRNLNAVLALLVLVEHTLSEQRWPTLRNWMPPSLVEELLSKPSTWFNVDHLVALFTLACDFETRDAIYTKLKEGIARKLKWFVVNRYDQVLESIKYEEMFKNNWKCVMEFTRFCIQDS